MIQNVSLPCLVIIVIVELEKTLLRKVGEAIHRFRMIRDGDRVAVALSGGKDSATLLEALLLLRDRAPIDFSVCAFTVEQGKFLRPIEPIGEYLRRRGVEWTYFRDNPSLQLLEAQPDHGCDLCSRFRRRAVYEIARGLGTNVIAFGHTADDFCEALLRNTMFTGKLSALPPVTTSRDGEFRLIRPLAFVTEASADAVNCTPLATSSVPSFTKAALLALKLVFVLIANVPVDVFVKLPCRLRWPPISFSDVIVPLLLIGPTIVTLLPMVSLFVNVIAPWLPLVMPVLVVSTACRPFVLATTSVCVFSDPPMVSDLTVTVLV